MSHQFSNIIDCNLEHLNGRELKINYELIIGQFFKSELSSEDPTMN